MVSISETEARAILAYEPPPGPWRYQEETEQTFGGVGHTTFEVYSASGDYEHIATLHSEHRARLVTAAPDLLKACQVAFRLVGDHEIPDCLCKLCELRNALRAAIAKATGGEA